MKKKILSLVMSICLCICSLFSLAGCSVVSEDSTKVNKKEVLKVGDNELTKADIINSFYTYYQSNSSYFSYYDEETIEDSFYSWAIIRRIVKDKAEAGLYDPDTNPNGFLIYNQEDADEVMDAVFEYIYDQVSTHEKSIYGLNQDIEEKDYPSWIREDEEEEETSGFEHYESSIPEIEVKNKADSVKKLTNEQVYEYIDDLKSYLFEYVSKEAETEDEEDVRSKIDETASKNYIVGARNAAFARYIEGLISNAKAAGTTTDEEEVLKAEVVRVYEAYYESQISTLLQEYYLENYLLDTENGDKESLSDKAVVEAYLNAYYTDVQKYQVEDGYVATMTNKDGASLVLYNYKGKNIFFTVQHILVKYDDYMTDEVSKLDGYAASGADYDKVIHDNFVLERNTMTDAYTMFTTINKDAVEQFGKAISVNGNYYYYDETLEGDSANNNGYILLDVSEVDGEKVYKKTGTDTVVDETDVQYLASEDDILNCYNTTLSQWANLCAQYIASDEDARADLVEEYESMDYVFEAALNIYTYGKKDGLTDESITNQIKKKLASLLFVELQWIYSTDSLGNELSNKMGYVISNYEDENGSWVVDFAVGARKIYAALQNGDTSALDRTNVITSNYGYHIIKVENIFESGKSLVDMGKLTKDVDLNDAEFVAEMADLLKQTYVCTSSNQTLFDYYYDTLYTEYVGSSESSGSYFMQLQYKWLAEYNSAGKIEYYEKLSYDELMDSIA